MLKHGCCYLVIFLSYILSSCTTGLWTGASYVYDRHSVYKKLNDYHLLADVTSAVNSDQQLKNENCSVDIAVFNGDVLIAGHLPTQEALAEINNRLKQVGGYRGLYNQLQVKNLPRNNLEDSWITTKIRSQIFADGSIDPNAFKVVTVDKIVYLMGDVKRDEAEKVIQLARTTRGVNQVVKLLKYFTYEPSNKVA